MSNIDSTLVTRTNKKSKDNIENIMVELREFNKINGTNISYGVFRSFRERGWLDRLVRVPLETELAELKQFNADNNCNLNLIEYADLIHHRISLDEAKKASMKRQKALKGRKKK